MNTARPYRQTTRAAATEATRRRIADAALELFLERWYDEVGLREVAAAAGVALQTVVNHFGTKEGLLQAVMVRFEETVEQVRGGVAPDDVPAAARALAEDYERTGDANIRALVLEDRIPAIAHGVRLGRAYHRAWVERTFPGALAGRRGAERERRVLALSAATDVTTWKHLRRDHGRSQADTAAVIHDLIEGLYR